jgi:hypothetical protein
LTGVSLIRAAATIRLPSRSWITVGGCWGRVAGAARVSIFSIIAITVPSATSTAIIAVISATITVDPWGISVVAVS